jgi:hypothetical protein
MAVWKLARSTKTCAITGKPLPPDANVLTALFGAEEDVSEDKVRGTGFVRRDYLVDDVPADALEAAVREAFCTWRSRTPPASSKPPRLDLGMARALLERMLAEGDPSRAPVVLTLALLLVRKRQLALVAEREGSLVLRWPKTTETFSIPAPVVGEAEEEGLQQELGRLFEF